jgi:ubiquinone/menaquinone biosynthesis C-methylase UbiE
VSFFVPDRRPQTEHLDQKGLPIREIERSLADIRWVNRYWGGHRAAETSILREILASAGDQTLLDLGAGSADVPERLARKSARRGISLSVCSLDLQIAHLATARGLFGGAVGRLVAGDALRLPFGDASFDWTLSAQFFHHFSPEENVRVLREMGRVARRGVFVLDLRRHRLARAAVMGLGPIFFHSSLTIEDARISVEQAYTIPEVAGLAREAGLENVAVRRAPPFRLVLSSMRPTRGATETREAEKPD